MLRHRPERPRGLTARYASFGEDHEVRAGISAFALAEQRAVGEGLQRLSRDLRSGAWHAKYRPILELEDFDAGYRFLRTFPALSQDSTSP